MRTMTLTTLLALSACTTEPVSSPFASSHALQPFESCEALRSYVTESALQQLVGSHYGDFFLMEDDADSSGPEDYTTTNVQEEGVDEDDFVKTDGNHVYVLTADRLAIVKSWPTEEASEIGGYPIEGRPRSMFLHGDQVIVFSHLFNNAVESAIAGNSVTRVTVLDVSDRTAPVVVREVDIEGYMTTGRMVDGRVYVVSNHYSALPGELWGLLSDDALPEPDWSASQEAQDAMRAEARSILEPKVAEIIEAVDLGAVLPEIHDRDSMAAPELMVACDEVYRPSETTQIGVLSVSQLDLNALEAPVTSTSLLADGYIVYGSKTSLYVARTNWGGIWSDVDTLSTVIHKFDIAGDAPTYTASGRVDGWLLNQFSMSEWDGHLRVATTDVDGWWTMGEDDVAPGSRVTVLKERRGALQTVGQVTDIAPGERIFSARMFGDVGYLVTFEQVDPLFTLDLSDHANPTIRGELKIPGFSTYLHPVDEDTLLSVGRDGDDDGRVFGMAVSLFDVSDFDEPKLAHKFTMGDENGWGWSEALYNHHAFTYRDGVLTIPANNYGYDDSGATSYFSGLMVLDVDRERGISEIGRVDHGDLVAQSACLYGDCYGYYSWYSPVRRAIYIEDDLFSISAYGVKVNELYAPENALAEVLFYPR